MVQPTGLSTELSDAAYLLEVFTAMPEFKGDWNTLALKHGVHISTVPRRFKAIAKRHGYKFENGKVTQDGRDAMAGDQSTEAPHKFKAKRAPKNSPDAKSAPIPKKRKLSEAIMRDEEDLDEAQDVVKVARAGQNKPIDGGEGGLEEAVDEKLSRSDGKCMNGAKRVKEGGEETAENDQELA